ncbi:apelin receptor B-like [Cyprinodon tularosa]|uniref:apelin receptor B-like n=1 Tax=Cyprinodon tularosa TaxID=77115 RepID=UPI0018E204E6|nr:apelin receptor B-like [Cyprinodon tularosa]
MASVPGINTSSSVAFYTNCSSSSTFLLSCVHPAYIAAAVIATLSCLLGIPTNLLIIVKLSSRLRGTSMTKRLFFNLALSDLLSLFCVLVAGVIFATGPHLPHKLCQFFFYVFLFCVTSSSNILLLISIQRYYKILHHSKWGKLTRTWQRVLLSSVWMLGALLSLPPALLLNEKNKGDMPSNSSCRNKEIHPTAELVYIAILMSGQLVLLFFYIKLVRGVKNIKMSDKLKQKINRLFSRILAVSLVDFLPLIARLVAVAAHITHLEMLYDINKYLTCLECIYFLNHCMNPLLFFFASRHQLGNREKKRKLFLMALNESS